MRSNAETRIKAQAVSRGISIGRAVCLYGKRRQYFRSQLLPGQVEKEIRRFRAAVRLVDRHLKRLEKDRDIRVNNIAAVIESHRMILADPQLHSEVESRITDELVNAEWAVKQVSDAFVSRFKSLQNENFRERQFDVEDVTERILTALGGGRRTSHRLGRGSIIVARELNPSTLIELFEYEPAGIVTEHGGWTSHTFILAREMSIPAVTGVRRALRRIHTGDSLIVDGVSGEVLLNPTNESFQQYAPKGGQHSASDAGAPQATLQTLDKRKIVVRANTDIPGGYEKAREFGARGVGLFRSEYISNRFRGVPTENEQHEAYRKIAELAGDDGVRIRTFDFGTEEFTEQPSGKCKNPALGLRAIRLSLSHERQLRDQLRALLRAADGTSVDIILPMVSDISEVRRVKALIDEERQLLAKGKVRSGAPRLGVMVEVPSTVLMIDELLDEVDVICLGTNDLVQYLLAVDRDNEDVADWFRTLSPAVIRSVKVVVQACEKRSVPCVVCGEMAGSPHYVPILIGLGATELSMNPNSIKRITDLISRINYDDTVRLLRNVEECRTAAEVESANRKFIAEHWSHLFENPTGS